MAAVKSTEPAKNNTAVPAHQAVLCFTTGVQENISVIFEPACRFAVVIAFIWVFPVIVNKLPPVHKVRSFAAATSAHLDSSNLLFTVILEFASSTVKIVPLAKVFTSHIYTTLFPSSTLM